MNPLISFLVDKFKKLDLSEDDLKSFFKFQFENSGEAKNNKIIKIKTKDEFKFVAAKKIETNLKNKHIYVEKFYQKLLEPYNYKVNLFFEDVNRKIKFNKFLNIKKIDDLKKLKLNILEAVDNLLKYKLEQYKLARIINFLKDSNNIGNWTIKPDMHIISVIPLLKINNSSLINLSRGTLNAGKFQKQVLKKINIINDCFNFKEYWFKDDKKKLMIIFYALDFCFNYNQNHKHKISPKDLDRAIFLYSTNNVKKFTRYYKKTSFQKKFEEKTKEHFNLKYNSNSSRHCELINYLNSI